MDAAIERYATEDGSDETRPDERVVREGADRSLENTQAAGLLRLVLALREAA